MCFSVGSTLKSSKRIKLSKFEEKTFLHFFQFLLDSLISGFYVNYGNNLSFYLDLALKRLSADTSESSNGDGMSSLKLRKIPRSCNLSLTFRVWWTLQCRIELSEKKESILVFQIKKTSTFLLTVITNGSKLFWIELILGWAKVNQLSFLGKCFS